MEPDMALKRWKFFRVFWPILCLGFAGFSLYQALIGVEKRFASDAGFILVPLVFFNHRHECTGEDAEGTK